MSFYTPNTAVHLCNVPLNINQKNQFCYNTRNGDTWNKQTQFNLFTNTDTTAPFHRTHVFTDFTYQRKEGIIRVPINAEILFADGTNYVVYDNVHYGNKWFYCFIKQIEFVNENCTHLHIETDVFQTWVFEMDLKYTFIEREHTITDNIFQHTLPEGLPTGDLVETHREMVTPSLSARTKEEFDQNYYIMIMSNDVIPDLGDYTQGQNVFTGGIPNGCYMYACTLANFADIINYISNPNAHENYNLKIDSIIGCYAIPKFMATFQNLTPTPTPPTPTPSVNLLGSPFNAPFSLTTIYDPPIHNGQDLVGTDDYIYATYDGEVVDSRWENDNDHNQGYGQLVRIYNSQLGLYFIYGHLNNRYVTVGQQVRAGDCIGIQGWTGHVVPSGRAGKHLHYQISEGWNNGTRNPSDFAQYPNQVGDYS